MRNIYDHNLALLATAPDTQIDAQATARLRALSKQLTIKSDELLAIIDDCVWASWASDFAIKALDALWQRMLKDEGITMEEALANRDPSLRTCGQ